MDAILNVDDYAPGRYARTRVLQQAGFVVYEAGTGKEALELATLHNPSLVLLDVNLPDIDGFEVCRQLRRDPRTFSSTIVHISASNIQAHHQIAGLEGGADSYLVEPVEPEVLIATVKAFFRARAAEEALRRSNEELERFGYRVAHDLTEPLRTIVAHTQLLEKRLGENPDEAVAASMRFVVDAANRMKLFIDGLLGFSRVTHQGGQVGAVDFEALFQLALQDLASAVQASGAHVSHDVLPTISAGSGFEQVFQNLISNAIKYQREGITPEIHVSAHADTDSWIFSVRDNGIGIEPRYRSDVFLPFRRLHGRDIPGSGIGLATCKKIVEAHGGAIWVESEPGSGSTFYFRLPRVAVTPLAHRAAEE